jgi:hypothetical protein
MKTKITAASLFLPLSIFFLSVKGQHVQVGSPLDLIMRESQLSDTSKHLPSLFIRPIALKKTDSGFNLLLPKEVSQDLLPGSLRLQPLQLDFSFNSFRPYGWNNGSMIMSKGVQSRISTGVLYTSKLFELNFQPEFVSAANRHYLTSELYGAAPHGPYNKMFLGQSYAEIKMGKLAFGFSNENLWLGPGLNSALIISNNAPGFGHMYFGTKSPIRSPVGDFELKLIAAGLDQDSLLSSEAYHHQSVKFSRRWRYFSGVTLSYQPRFIPGLYVGFNRMIQFYNDKNDTSAVSFFNRYVPAASAFFKKKIYTQLDAQGQDDAQDQVASVFMRFLMPKEKFEIYFEYGYNDFKANLRDFIQDVQHSTAFVLGFKKLFPSRNHYTYSIAGEIVQMSQSNTYLVRNAANWYVSRALPEGLTQFNQILGAGSGVGNNVQSVQLERINGPKRIGFKLLRIQNDPRMAVGNVNNLWINKIFWTDIAYGPNVQWQFKNILLKGELQFVHSKNYAWIETSKFNLFTGWSVFYKW